MKTQEMHPVGMTGAEIEAVRRREVADEGDRDELRRLVILWKTALNRVTGEIDEAMRKMEDPETAYGVREAEEAILAVDPFDGLMGEIDKARELWSWNELRTG